MMHYLAVCCNAAYLSTRPSFGGQLLLTPGPPDSIDFLFSQEPPPALVVVLVRAKPESNVDFLVGSDPNFDVFCICFSTDAAEGGSGDLARGFEGHFPEVIFAGLVTLFCEPFSVPLLS